MIKKIVLVFIFIFGSLNLKSEVCGTEYTDSIPSPIFVNSKNNYILSSGAISIPIVVHVIYNTATQNISVSQILSQINVLNEDFRKMVNTPGDNTNNVGSDTKI